MWQLLAPPADRWTITDLTLQEELPHKAVQESVLEAFRGRHNRVQFGIPQTIDVLASWPPNYRLLAELENGRGAYDFYFVRLAMSLLPDRGCRFTYARLSVELSTAVAVAEDPIVLDLFPRMVETEQTVSRSFTLRTGVNFGFSEVSAEAKRDADGIRYQPLVVATGLLTHAPSWTFSSDSSNGITGIKELFMLVKKPKATDLIAQFSLSAEVRTFFGLFRYSGHNLVDIECRLIP